jgi:hypothetical protein
MKEIFGRADAWYKENRERLERDHPGKHLTINAADLTYVVGKGYNQAHALYKEVNGPTPPNGRSTLDVDFPKSR